MVGARVRRQQVAYARSRGLSSRRACALLLGRTVDGGICVAACGQRDAPAVAGDARARRRSIRATATARSGSSSARQGHAMSPERTYRLWRQAGLQVPKRRPRRRVATVGRGRAADRDQSRWAYDFVFDTCADGRSLKCLTIVDEFTRECLAIDVAGSIRSGRVIEVLTQLVSVHGAPRYLRSDNGPEFVATAILRWLQTADDRDGVHRSGQALAEWHGRIVQREVSQRVFDGRVVSESARRQGRHRALAAALQRRAPAHEPRRSDARRVQVQERPGRNGSGDRRSPIISGPNSPGRSPWVESLLDAVHDHQVAVHIFDDGVHQPALVWTECHAKPPSLADCD